MLPFPGPCRLYYISAALACQVPLFERVSTLKLYTFILTIITQGLKQVYYTADMLAPASPQYGFLQGSSLQHK